MYESAFRRCLVNGHMVFRVPENILGTFPGAASFKQHYSSRKDFPMKKNPFLVAGLGLLALMAAACNTIEGAGEDVEATGDAIDQAAEDAS